MVEPDSKGRKNWSAKQVADYCARAIPTVSLIVAEDGMRELVLETGFPDCAFPRGFLPPPVWGESDTVFCVARR